MSGRFSYLLETVIASVTQRIAPQAMRVETRPQQEYPRDYDPNFLTVSFSPAFIAEARPELLAMTKTPALGRVAKRLLQLLPEGTDSLTVAGITPELVQAIRPALNRTADQNGPDAGMAKRLLRTLQK